MAMKIEGNHHVTGIAGDAQTNLDFYTGLLGLRLVKLTVNFDDPGSYHFYYGDASGRPGTILTFFPHPGGFRGKVGSGQTSAVALSIPIGSLDFWQNRLAAEAVAFEAPSSRLGETYIAFEDPDGLRLELVENETASHVGWNGGDVPQEFAVTGVHSVSLLHHDSTEAARTLELMGYSLTGEEGNRRRFSSSADIGRHVDLIQDPSASRAQGGVGAIHHVAFRTPDDAAQADWLLALQDKGYHVSPVMDRDYFHSIYFREPGGVLFEIATDSPGFEVDEPFEQLGTDLKLPKWLEPRRSEVERIVPPLRLPGTTTAVRS